MRAITLNFVTLHYAYIIFLGLLGLIVLYPYGNVKAVDAYFFGVSSSTNSGLNTIDIKDLKTYQQLYTYFVPIVGHFAFINIVVVIVRLYAFEKRFKEIAPSVLRSSHDQRDLESQGNGDISPQSDSPQSDSLQRSITFAPDVVPPPSSEKALHVPSPRERDRGVPLVELDESADDDEDTKREGRSLALIHQRSHDGPSMGIATSIERVAASLFVLGSSTRYRRPPPIVSETSLSRDLDLPQLSSHATVGRNSDFKKLTERDREVLGGIEYRSLRLLLKIIIGYFFGLHLFGAICLVGWIRHANPKYRDYIGECGQDNVWWAFYSAQTMVDNLGLTLTPDSMVSFQDAVFPMLLMSFLAFAGNTLYPCFLRLAIWTMYKCVPSTSSLKEPLNFLLRYPRRCYTLLFPSQPTWVLFGIIFVLNFVDTLLILVLDLDNPAVNHLPAGPRIAAALYQAASARHTGTASFNLADVNPAVQFTLVIMMYISVFPIAISIRSSNVYEERSLGIYPGENDLDELNGISYAMAHVRNQLSFDLWFIFLGIFCICVAESSRVMDDNDPGFSVFAILFEVVSAYANVGLSLGYPTVLTSLSGQFSTFGKLVICAMMIRGRHRGLPSQLDRAIMLPSDREEGDGRRSEVKVNVRAGPRVKRWNTS